MLASTRDSEAQPLSAGAASAASRSPPRGVRKPGSPHACNAYFSRLRRTKTAAQATVRTALAFGSEEGIPSGTERAAKVSWMLFIALYR